MDINADLALWMIDRVTGKILDWNTNAVRICGWEKVGCSRSVKQLAQLFFDAESEGERVSVAQVVGLGEAPPTGQCLVAKLRTPGLENQSISLEALDTGLRQRGRLILLAGRIVPSQSSDGHGINALSAILGHELNNISVPLDGFGEIAIQNAAPDSTSRKCLEEMLIGIARLRAIATQLEILGESESKCGRVAIEKCMPSADDRSTYRSWTVEWLCNSGTAVRVDRLHAQRAIHSLLSMVSRVPVGSPTAPVLTISQNLPPEVTCATCRATLMHTDKDIQIKTDDSRPVAEKTLRDPFGASAVGRSGHRLTVATLVHSTHKAGGHVLFDRRSGSLSLAFPAD